MRNGETKWLNDFWGIYKRKRFANQEVRYQLIYDKRGQAVMASFPSKRQLIVSLKRTYIRCDIAPDFG